MKHVFGVVIGLCCLASCGDNLPVTDNEAILGKWYCKLAYEEDGMQTDMYLHSELFANGKRKERANIKISGEGARLNVALDITGKWRLSSETLVKTSSKRKLANLKASGVAFDGLTDTQIKRLVKEQLNLGSAKDDLSEDISIRGLTSDSMDMMTMVGSRSHTANCKRPDAI